MPIKKSLGELDTTHLKITAAPTLEGLNTATISISWKIGDEPMTFTYNVSVNGLPNNKTTPITPSSLVLEPNPVASNSIITAQLPVNSRNWQLTDLNGRIVQEGLASGAELSFVAPQNGMYIFTVFTLDGKTQSTKILVQ
ncbi:MAG: T9SS type A sorting domain-containing protein [Bacteroidetes bacterium]|nr:T9SS type A sorting domain-containing protein [Bacteroidota bacterium]